MKKFSDWDRNVSDEELKASEERLEQLLNEVEASESESEIEERLNRSAACRFAGEASVEELVTNTCEMFNNVTMGIGQLIIILANNKISEETDEPAIRFFYEVIRDYAVLLRQINDNMLGIFSSSFEESEELDLEYSASVAKMGMQAATGAIFAAVRRVLSPDNDLIPTIMGAVDEDMTVYDIAKIVEENYLLAERTIDFEPTGGVFEPDDTATSSKAPPRAKTRHKKKKKSKQKKS